MLSLPLVSLLLLVSCGLSCSLVTYQTLSCSASLFFAAGQVFSRVYRDHLPRIYKALRAVLIEGLIFITRQPFVYIEVLKLLQERLRS
jgi:hypothetical protein